MRAVGQAGLVRRRDVWLRGGTAMGEANFLFAGNEHVQGPAEGLSSAGAPGQPAHAARPLAEARRHHTRSREPCTCRGADSSPAPSCFLRPLSWEFLGSNHPSRCSLLLPAAGSTTVTAGHERSQQEAAAGPCCVPVRADPHRRTSLAPRALVGTGTDTHPRL